MRIYTYSEARQNLASVLEKARQEGEILIKRKDGTFFVVRPLSREKSPLDIPGIDLNMSVDEIVSVIREIRER